MGVRLMVEVLNHPPKGSTPAERLLLVALAEKADDYTRRVIWSKADGDRRAFLANRVGVTEHTLRALFGKLGSRGYEARVQTGTDKRGRKVFAFEGHVADYVIPPLPLPESRDSGVTSEWCDESLTTTQEVTLSSLGAETTVAPPEPERCDESLALVPSFPLDSDPRASATAPEADAVASLLVRFGGDLTETDAIDAVDQVLVQYEPDDAGRYMAGWPIEHVVKAARRARKRRKDESAAAALNASKCDHDMVNGREILGRGEGASRRCGVCEAEDPAEARTVPISSKRGDIDWGASTNRAVARDARDEAVS